MGKYQKVREIIREVLKDGKVHTAEELHKLCEDKGIEISRNRSEIYNTVHQLKKKGEIASDGENGYILLTRMSNHIPEKERECSTNVYRRMESRIAENVDLSDFEIVEPAIRKEAKQVISIFDNGDLALNSALSKVLKANRVEIRIKKDCSQILLTPNGTVLLDIAKNNRIKNYTIYEKLKKKKVKFPVYYVGEWNEEKEYWMGDLVMTNPNKTAGKEIK